MLLFFQTWTDFSKPVTLYEFIYLVLVFLTLVATIIGFIVLIKSFRTSTRQTEILAEQTKLLSESFKANVFQLNDNQMFKIDEIFVISPELRKFFYNGARVEKGDKDYEKAVSIAFYLLDFFAMVLIQKEQHGSLVPLGWYDEWMNDVFKNSPIVCDCLKERKNWYPNELIEFMEYALQEENTQVTTKKETKKETKKVA